MNKTFFLTAIFTMLLFACAEETTTVEPIQQGDKKLTCQELLFEINDAEFYTKQAKEKKALGIKSIVMPLGYIDTYMTADEAIAAAAQRIEYLQRIYDIRNCENLNNMPNLPQGQVPFQQYPANNYY